MNISRAIISSIVAILLSSPTITRAEGRQITYTLNTQSDRSYQAVIQQAEFLAGKLIEQAFAQNPKLTQAAVSIIGERNGQEVPLLAAKVSRANWQQKPQIESWTQYFNDSAILLGFKQAQPATNTARLPNRNFINKEVGYSHLEPNFYQ